MEVFRRFRYTYVETHIYRLRKKIKEIFNDETFIKSEKKGYTI